MPRVQRIGSTAGCGCDFPHLLLQKGEWLLCDFRDDACRDQTHRSNQEALATLLRATGEGTVELYGVWVGNEGKTPEAREAISLQTILDPEFYFKEQGFYTVTLTD
jgi:hypothetical protein